MQTKKYRSINNLVVDALKNKFENIKIKKNNSENFYDEKIAFSIFKLKDHQNF
jgi:hypothetical protein